jgi:hypothetical protein
MKKKILLCLILISVNTLCSQNNYEIDSLVSVNIPGKDIKIDTLLNENLKFQSNIENSEFSVQKELIENDSISGIDSKLPYDLESLENYYRTLANDFVNGTNLNLEFEKIIKKNNFKGYHLKFSDINSNSIYEIEYFILNKKFYLFSYINDKESDRNDNDIFFNSIKINSNKKITQFSGKSPIEKSAYNLGYKIGYTAAKHPSYLWIAGGLILLLVIGIIVYFVKKR